MEVLPRVPWLAITIRILKFGKFQYLARSRNSGTERPIPLSCVFVDKKCDFFLSVFSNTEKPLLLKTTARLLFNLRLLNLYPYLFRSYFFLDILISYEYMKPEKRSFIALSFREDHDARSPEDAGVKPPRVLR